MGIVEWRFVYIILTFAIIGVVCSLKRFKAGILAASTGIGATLIVWGCRVITLKIKSFFGGDGFDFKQVSSIITCILVSIIVFVVLALLFEIFNRKKRKRRK